jgi:transcriptional regulator with XRE-family HTH domain
MGSGTDVSPGHRATEGQIEDALLVLVTQLTNEITWYMRERGLTRADLAGRMGVSPGRVSQILGGGENLTLRTLAAMSTALDARFDIELSARTGDGALGGEGALGDGGAGQGESVAAGKRRSLSRNAQREARLGR